MRHFKFEDFFANLSLFIATFQLNSSWAAQYTLAFGTQTT